MMYFALIKGKCGRLLAPFHLIRFLERSFGYSISVTGLFYFVLFSQKDKTIKLWKISERDKRAEGYNLKDEDGRLRDQFRITTLRVSLPLLFRGHFELRVQPVKVGCAVKHWFLVNEYFIRFKVRCFQNLQSVEYMPCDVNTRHGPV